MYPVDFRAAALKLYDYFQSMRKTAKALNVSVASLSRWNKSLYPKERLRSKLKLSDAMVIFVQQLVTSNPSLKCIDIAKKVNSEFNVNVSRQLVHLILKRLDYSFKRIRKRGKSIKKEELKNIFVSTMLNLPRNTIIVSIDESGFDQRAVPIYGYSLKGQPAIMEYKTSSDRHHYSLLIQSDGKKHYCIHKESVTSQKFTDFIKSMDLVSGSVLLMDNAAIHKSKAFKEYVNSKNCQIIFTPPYSPEFNPIEMIFGVIKNYYYKQRYQMDFEVGKAISTSVSKITDSNITNCFNHLRTELQK